MIHFTALFNIEAMPETELLSLYARLFAALAAHAHSVEEQSQLLLALQRIREALRKHSSPY